jgi:hypothetical protein
MQNSSKGRAIVEFFIAAPKYIIAFFLPFLVFWAIVQIFLWIDYRSNYSLSSAIVLSTVIAALAYYYKK